MEATLMCYCDGLYVMIGVNVFAGSPGQMASFVWHLVGMVG